MGFYGGLALLTACAGGVIINPTVNNGNTSTGDDLCWVIRWLYDLTHKI